MAKLIRKRDIIRGVRARWNGQYSRYQDHEVIGRNDNRRSIKEIRRDLERLDLETCPAADVVALLGTSWVENKCDECGEDRETLVQFGKDEDYDDRWQNICASCLASGVALLSDGSDNPAADQSKD